MVENNANTPLTDENLPLEEEAKKESFLEKLQNFKILTTVNGAIALFSIIALVLTFVFFSIDRVYYNGPNPDAADIREENQLVGGIFFTIMVFALIMTIATIYFALPFIKNKTKLSPTKTVGYLSLISGCLLGVSAIFSFLTIVLADFPKFDKHPTPALWVVSGLLLAISAAAMVLIFFRYLSVKLYMPKPKIKK